MQLAWNTHAADDEYEFEYSDDEEEAFGHAHGSGPSPLQAKGDGLGLTRILGGLTTPPRDAPDEVVVMFRSS